VLADLLARWFAISWADRVLAVGLGLAMLLLVLFAWFMPPNGGRGSGD
jgi:hypothetical protein